MPHYTGGARWWPILPLRAKAAAFARFVVVEHTLFALPFAYAGAFLAAGGWPGGAKAFWITVAMFGARSAALGLNRIIDRHIDARNPRTRDRELPAGRLSLAEAWAFTLACLGLLTLAAWRLNPLCLKLVPVAVAALVVYPYAKRFTWTCHYWMVPAQAFAPLGGWIAVTGRFELAPVLLGLAVGLWIAGFDILYALQDLEFDRASGLHSLPASVGVPAALLVSRLTHVVVVGLLAALAAVAGLGAPFYAALALAALLLAYQHSLVSPRDLSAAARAFNVNLAVGPLLFLGIVADVLA